MSFWSALIVQTWSFRPNLESLGSSRKWNEEENTNMGNEQNKLYPEGDKVSGGGFMRCGLVQTAEQGVATISTFLECRKPPEGCAGCEIKRCYGEVPEGEMAQR